jgi:hypothetical protein
MIGIIGLMMFANLGLAAETGPEGEQKLIFDYQGTIDRISNDDIVLDDSWFKLAAHITFYTKDGDPAYRSGFKVGVRVDFHLDNLGQVDALRLTN